MQNFVRKEKNPRISDSIATYFWNHGHNRGIEKFLKLRSRSNSDSSISNPSNVQHRSIEKLTKSLENVSDSTMNKVSKKSLSEKELRDENFKSKKLFKNIDKTSDNHSVKVSIKQKSEKNAVKTKTPYNFNVESVVEINMPTSFLQQFTKVESIENLNSIVCSEAQTSNAMVFIEELSESTTKLKNNLLAVSPSDSSVASISNKQMEWDALADIGYEKYSLCNANELDDSEIKALKTYFNKQGKSFDEKVVVLRNKNTDLKQQNIIMDDEEHKLRLSVIKKNREKWQNIYEKYKEKYQQTKSEFTDFLPSTSTPKLILQKKGEKSSQTSLIKNSTRSTQVNNEMYNSNLFSQNLKTSNSELLNLDQSIGTETPHESETAASFEFIAIKKKSSKEQRNKHSMTASSSSMASTNNSINMSYNEELQLAITLLKSLLDSKKMNSELKKNLASKIIQKIIVTQTSRSIQTSTIDLSENIKGNSFSIKSEEKIQNSKLNPSGSYGLEEFLEPQTNSEIEHQNQIIQRNSTSSKNKSKSSNETSSRLNPHYNKRNLNLIAYVKREKISQLNWIENEIDHLNSLRELLVINEDSSSTNTNQKSKMADVNISYENVASSIDQITITDIPERNDNKMTPRHTEELVLHKQHNTKINKFINWDSHVNIKKYGKHRSKLETPGASDQINKSSSNYKVSVNEKSLKKDDKIQPPYYIETNHYSDAKQYKKGTTSHSADFNASTSLASSEVFVSSESISISNENENYNRTTHDPGDSSKDRRVFGTQTCSNSVLNTKPMFISKEKKHFEHIKVTSNDKMVKKTKKIDIKQSIMYTLTFDKKDFFKIEKKSSSLPQNRESKNVLSLNVNRSKEIINRMHLNSFDQHQEDKVSSAEEIVKNVEYIELENCLNERKPKLFQKFEERKKCIQELKKLRY